MSIETEIIVNIICTVLILGAALLPVLIARYRKSSYIAVIFVLTLVCFGCGGVPPLAFVWFVAIIIYVVVVCRNHHLCCVDIGCSISASSNR